MRCRRKSDLKYNRSIRGRYRELRRSAKVRRIKFDLTFSEYAWLVDGARCTYCEGRLPRSGTGLDRLENHKGYCVQNAVPCCTDCNKIKGEVLSPVEMQAVAKLLKTMRKASKSSQRRKLERLRRVLD